MKIYIANGEKFLSRVLNRYFGIQLSDLHFSTLIEDPFIKSLIARAEYRIADKKYIEAIVAVRDAFKVLPMSRTIEFATVDDDGELNCTLKGGMLFMYGRLDKADKQRMGLVGAALEFGMELNAYEEVLAR